MAFAELCITSNFTFLTGGSHPQEYALRAIELGLPAFAIADRNSVAGLVRAHQELREAARGGQRGAAPPSGGAALPGRRRAGADRASARPRRLGAALPGALAGGAAGEEGVVPAACGGSRRPRARCTSSCTFPRAGRSRPGCRGRGISPGAIPGAHLVASPRYDGQDRARIERAARLADELGLRLVASAEPIMHHGSRRRLVDVLTCIREGRRIDTIGRAAQANAERRLRPEAEMLRLFAGHEAAVHRAGEIAAECRFALDSLRYEYPREIWDGEDPQARLERLTARGLAWRYPHGVPEKAAAQAAHELALIGRLELCALLPDRQRRGGLRPLPGDPLPGARVGGELGGLLRARGHLGRRPRSAPWSSSASCRRRATSRRTSTSTSSTSGARR